MWDLICVKICVVVSIVSSTFHKGVIHKTSQEAVKPDSVLSCNNQIRPSLKINSSEPTKKILIA